MFPQIEVAQLVLVICKVDWQIRSPLPSAFQAQFTENSFVTNVMIVSIGRISIKGVGDLDWPIVYGQWSCDYIRGPSAFGAEYGIWLFSHLVRCGRSVWRLSVTESIRRGAGALTGRLISRNSTMGDPNHFSHTLSFLRIIDNVRVSPPSSPKCAVSKA